MSKKIKKCIDIKKNIWYIWKVLWEKQQWSLKTKQNVNFETVRIEQ